MSKLEPCISPFTHGAEGLVPGALGAVGVVLGDARRGDGETADRGACLGDVTLGVALGLLVLALGLRVCQPLVIDY